MSQVVVINVIRGRGWGLEGERHAGVVWLLIIIIANTADVMK